MSLQTCLLHTNPPPSPRQSLETLHLFDFLATSNPYCNELRLLSAFGSFLTHWPFQQTSEDVHRYMSRQERPSAEEKAARMAREKRRIWKTLDVVDEKGQPDLPEET